MLDAPFDPASLVRGKDGTFTPKFQIESYSNEHLKRCLTKEERDALFREHPRPNLDSCVPPKVDKYIVEFLGKRYHKDHDSELTKIQAAVLAGIRPLTSAWDKLMELEPDEDSDVVYQHQRC